MSTFQDTPAGATIDPQATRPVRSPTKARGITRFWQAALCVLGLVLVGAAIGVMIEGFGPPPAARPLNFGEYIGALALKDWVFCAFVLSAVIFLVLQRDGVRRFFRSMHVGVVLVAFSALSVLTGVLVPQIDGFEDPHKRVPSISDIPLDTLDATLEKKPEAEQLQVNLRQDQRARLKEYRDQFGGFSWAEGYFFYHLRHIYGMGMPHGVLPPNALAGLERFRRVYGQEEGDNREKQMRAMFDGQVKSAEIEAFVQRHTGFFHACFDLATALQLNRTYKSNWFAALLTLLFCGVAINAFKGKPANWVSTAKIGFFTVHLGVMILLIGGGYSKLKTDRGILPLDKRAAPTDTYFANYNESMPTRMPFSIKLEEFARSDWKTIQVGFFDEDFKSNPPELTLWPDRQVELDWRSDEQGQLRPSVRIRCLALAQRSKIHPPQFREAGVTETAQAIGPLVMLGHKDASDTVDTVDTGHPGDDAIFLRPSTAADLYVDPSWRFRLRTAFSPEHAKARELFPLAHPVGWLAMRSLKSGDIEPARRPINVGDSFDAPGGFKVKVEAATGNYQLDKSAKRELVDPRPLAEQEPQNPGVTLLITPAGGGQPERRVVLQAIDAEEYKLQKGFLCSDLALKLEWDEWTVPGPPSFVLVWGGMRGPELFTEDGQTIAAALGEPLAIPSAKGALVLQQLFENAHFEKQIEFLAKDVEGPRFDPDFYATDPSGAELEITQFPGTAKEQRQIVRMASSGQHLSNLWTSPDGRFWVRYYHNTQSFPFEWRSVLGIYEKDSSGRLAKVDLGPAAAREIRVNDYLLYRGYRFFQTDANADRPTYSGIGVVYDPGIPLVLFGMYTIILGTVLTFLVRPIATMYGKKARSRSST